jgi:hypothetical protein
MKCFYRYLSVYSVFPDNIKVLLHDEFSLKISPSFCKSQNKSFSLQEALSALAIGLIFWRLVRSPGTTSA